MCARYYAHHISQHSIIHAFLVVAVFVGIVCVCLFFSQKELNSRLRPATAARSSPESMSRKICFLYESSSWSGGTGEKPPRFDDQFPTSESFSLSATGASVVTARARCCALLASSYRGTSACIATFALDASSFEPRAPVALKLISNSNRSSLPLLTTLAFFASLCRRRGNKSVPVQSAINGFCLDAHCLFSFFLFLFERAFVVYGTVQK